jgi:beta-lactamase regulating signal transducer with metallopeptidase domain
MTTDLLVLMFLKAQAAASAAILLVLLLRAPARRLIGAELTYRLWLLVPTAAFASLFPTLPQFRARIDQPASGLQYVVSGSVPAIGHGHLLAFAWAIGAALMIGLLAAAQWRFERKARQGQAGPAATGFWPRMIVPSDYAKRFDTEERTLIRAHERAHMDRRDPAANLTIAVLQAICWFNPLVHLAANLARMDQELSVDAQVMARHPKGRRRYAETLLKAQAQGFASPLACALALGGRHPLEVRLKNLGMGPISIRRDLAGVTAIGALAVVIAVALWTLAPL